MQPRTKGLVAAVTGAALGVTGLALVAMPAGADDAPNLPEISAQELVSSTLQADPPAFAGSVAVHNDLGLPSGVPGMDFADFDSARVFHDGDDGFRVSVQDGNAEYTLVANGDEAWAYNSSDNTATRFAAPDGDKTGGQERAKGHHKGQRPEEMADPARAAQEIVQRLSETSTITVDGTARVADRAAYELVLTPKPSERTVLREVKVAIDSQTRLPLRLEVMANGTPEPIFSLGFDEFSVGEQPERLFDFTPPKGVKIEDATDKARERAEQAPAQGEKDAAERFGESLQVVGEGWDTVVTGAAGEELLSARPQMQDGQRGMGERDEQSAKDLLERYGKRVSGEFGSGYVITTKAGSGLITDDGRFAVGAVPVQVLEQALTK